MRPRLHVVGSINRVSSAWIYDADCGERCNLEDCVFYVDGLDAAICIIVNIGQRHGLPLVLGADFCGWVWSPNTEIDGRVRPIVHGDDE